MGGAFTTSINSYNFGPIPFTYPSYLGWILNSLFSNYNISQFYITQNILYFITLFIILLTTILIFKFFGKTGGYIFIFIMISSISINTGNKYFTTLPTHLNPGSLQFYSILLLFLFLLSMFDNKKTYYLLLIFFSGIFLQNYIASGFMALILLLYSILFLIKNYKLSFRNNVFLALALIP